MCIKVWIIATNLKKTRNTEQTWEEKDSLLSNEVDFLLADIKTEKVKNKTTKREKKITVENILVALVRLLHEFNLLLHSIVYFITQTKKHFVTSTVPPKSPLHGKHSLNNWTTKPALTPTAKTGGGSGPNVNISL